MAKVSDAGASKLGDNSKESVWKEVDFKKLLGSDVEEMVKRIACD
jgi:hypothetical protein